MRRLPIATSHATLFEIPSEQLSLRAEAWKGRHEMGRHEAKAIDGPEAVIAPRINLPIRLGKNGSF
jgi:hypothetical protein